LRVVSKKKHLIDRLNQPDLPPSYTSNTSKEETILEYVEDFRRQFVQVFPERRPLLLCPLNEAGVRKFVCTTVRPTLLPYNSVYNLKDTARFVSDFLEYLHTDEPTRLPDILASPTTTLELRAGDCLDFANLLVSLLRGAAYDAYVVSGYAPKWVCVQDEAKCQCPIIEETENPLDRDVRLKEEVRIAAEAAKPKRRPPRADDHAEEGDAAEATGDNAEAEGEEAAAVVEKAEKKEKYPTKRQPDHNSMFLAMKEQQIADEKETKRVEHDLKTKFVTNEVTDPLHGNRVHCWVMVLAGKRGVQETLFVEPSTGTIFKQKDSPYVGIESIWNEQNYWANVQEESPQEMSFDLKNSDCWEYVLIEEPKIDGDAKPADSTPFGQDAPPEKDPEEIPPEEAFDDERDILDCPISWAKRIVVDRLVFRDRFPKESRSIHYHRCTVQKYSEHLEGHNGLVLRVMIFQTDECITPIEIREMFKHRQDKLHSRYVYPLAGRVHMMFEPGRKYGLKDYILEEKKRSFTFFSKARVDGMITRNELIGQKVVEEFEDRDDFLIYRSVKVVSKIDSTPQSSYSVELAPQTEGVGKPVLKITQKFSRNEKVPAEQDVRKRTHFIADQTIRLDYHYPKRSIVAATLLLDKNDRQIGSDTLGDLNDYSTGRGREHEKPNPHAKEHKELLAKLVVKEKDLLSEVKDDEKEMTQLLKELDEEALDVVLEKSIYDLAQEQAKDEEKEREDQVDEKLDKNKVDYLSPFVVQYKGPLDHRQAMQAKDECLAALKERLLERANIIQQHLNAENQSLHQKKITYKRSTGSGAVEADEEFTKTYEAALFRIDILRARLAKHEELAVKKYCEMDGQLNNDHRLRALREIPEGGMK